MERSEKYRMGASCAGGILCGDRAAVSGVLSHAADNGISLSGLRRDQGRPADPAGQAAGRASDESCGFYLDPLCPVPFMAALSACAGRPAQRKNQKKDLSYLHGRSLPGHGGMLYSGHGIRVPAAGALYLLCGKSDAHVCGRAARSLIPLSESARFRMSESVRFRIRQVSDIPACGFGIPRNTGIRMPSGSPPPGQNLPPRPPACGRRSQR